MKKTVVTFFIIGFVGYVNAQFTYPNTNEIHTSDELVIPVIRISNELRLPSTFVPNDPSIGTLDNTGYGINIHKTEGIGFAFNNVHRVFFTPNGNIRTSSSNPAIHIEGTGNGNYQGATLILSAKGVNSGNSHVSTWLMTHRGTDGIASIGIQRRGLNAKYNGSLLTYRDGTGWKFAVASNPTSGLTNAMNIDNKGNVGIGTTTPLAKLHINSTADVGRGQKPALLIGKRDEYHIDIDGNEIGAFHNNSNAVLYLNGSQSTSNTVINGDGTGNVGISTTTPSSKLSLYGTSAQGWNSGIELNREDGGKGWIVVDNGGMKFRTPHNGDGFHFRDNDNNTSLIIQDGGNIGIGTTNPNGWKLAVNGKIRAKEIKVETGWADYVFEENYELPTLKEVENYIRQKGHLKNIPSALEVEKNGIQLGEMNVKLLEKIEELTLYTIAQEKQIQTLTEVQKQNTTLEERVENLEKIIANLLNTQTNEK